MALKMKSLYVYTLGFILFQTIISVLISWAVLSCSMRPHRADLYELVLLKFLYLYEPAACGYTIFYNYTIGDFRGIFFNTVLWVDKNDVAEDFRTKVVISLALHIIWLILAVANCYQGLKPCAQYFVYVSFALVGAAMLITDLVFCILFLLDLQHTKTEVDILNFVSSDQHQVYYLDATTKHMRDTMKYEELDTTWIPLMMAYGSIRGLVGWFVNFYIVKDNFMDGFVKQRAKRKGQRNLGHATITL